MTSTNSDVGYSRRWIEVARKLTEDPERKVLCPSCKKDFLWVFDVPYKVSTHVRRYMVCRSCGDSSSMGLREQAGCTG